jgi:hypothetical protein
MVSAPALKLHCDEPVSNFARNFKLRRYTVVLNKAHAEMHPEYDALIGPLRKFPTLNPGGALVCTVCEFPFHP